MLVCRAMKTKSQKRFPLFVLAACFSLILVDQTAAQIFTTLYNFTGGTDGANPYSGLILSSNTLYGTALYGGNAGQGTVFKINTDGGGFTILHSFAAGGYGYNSSHQYVYTNSDGAYPDASLILSGNTLYGTATGGGSEGDGTVFAVNTDGTGFTNLHTFIGSDGYSPQAGLVLSSNTLYGVTTFNSTIFSMSPDGTGFTNLHTFTGSDGTGPDGTLILSGNTLYGTASSGGSSDSGTIFAMNTDGTGFTNLYSFTAVSSPVYSNSDGAYPYGGLILSGNTLYGTAANGGSAGNGTIFAVNTDGTGFTNLHNFSPTDNYTNTDGTNPQNSLLLFGNTLYGTAYYGGREGYGTVFALNTDGSGFTNLYNFAEVPPSGPYTNSAGTYPSDNLILSGNTLFGTANYGGSSGDGTVFSLSLPPPYLTIIHSVKSVILTWPNYAPGVILQFATNLVTPDWSTNLPTPVLVSGQNTVTNPISGSERFFRLNQ